MTYALCNYTRAVIHGGTGVRGPRVAICRVFININVRLSIIAVGASSAIVILPLKIERMIRATMSLTSYR